MTIWPISGSSIKDGAFRLPSTRLNSSAGWKVSEARCARLQACSTIILPPSPTADVISIRRRCLLSPVRNMKWTQHRSVTSYSTKATRNGWLATPACIRRNPNIHYFIIWRPRVYLNRNEDCHRPWVCTAHFMVQINVTTPIWWSGELCQWTSLSSDAGIYVCRGETTVYHLWQINWSLISLKNELWCL